MADVAYTPWAINNATLQLGTDTFQDAVNRAEFVPTYQNENYDTINGNSHPVASVASWMLNLDLGQDWASATSLSNYLAANDGTEVTAILTSASGDKKMTGTVLIRAGAFGGVAKRNATASVQLPVNGTPLLEDAA